MMKKQRIWLAVAVLAATLLLIPCSLAEGAESVESAEPEQAEWTVMFYLCGSNLESQYGYATETMEEIAGCWSAEYVQYMGSFGDYLEEDLPIPNEVNVVLETGGSETWHAQEELGLEVRTDRLQRWSFHPGDSEEIIPSECFTLEEEPDLVSMAQAETLADFIRWSAAHYPAKKYALVLWSHGGGSKTGILIDELFDGDILRLDELHDALEGGGVQLETVLFDACMMASVETACAVKDNARWMVASEEEVAGRGSAVRYWLQQLYVTPGWDGQRLGRSICEATQKKYAEEGEDQSQQMLTWSVIDLSKADRVVALFDALFKGYGERYVSDPIEMGFSAAYLRETAKFGLGDSGMYDLGGIFYQPDISGQMSRELYEGMLEALQDAVVYLVRGPGRSGAYGLSFCLATDFTPEEMDVYLHNCPSPHYLALLDAIIPEWDAPEELYEQVERLPDIRELEAYQLHVEKRLCAHGIPGLSVSSRVIGWNVHVDLYQLSERTGNVIRLGRVQALPDLESSDDPEHQVYTLDRFWRWPAVEGVHCTVELAEGAQSFSYEAVYNIPILLSGQKALLRCGYDAQAEEKYQTLGLWQGYELDGDFYTRGIAELSKVAGQEFVLLYPIYKEEERTAAYDISAPLTMYRRLEIGAKTLPEGYYYFDFWIEDMFMREVYVGGVTIYWDGEKVLEPEEPWEGSMTLPGQ